MRLRVLKIPRESRDDHPYVVVAKVRRGPVLVYAWPEWRVTFSLRQLQFRKFAGSVSRFHRPPDLAKLPEPR
jgi:hypothetical protein